jgi:aryl-alcohol dehydrogenase-like predicted oxidoreductase
MEYRLLGKSDLQISRIGFGCMSLDKPDDQAENLLNRALEMGINYFDSADLYQKGWNEIILGRALAAKRDKVILATKVGNQWRPDGSGWDWSPSKKYILSAIDRSLDRLKTDYIDLYQLHGGTIEDPIDEIIEAFELLKAAGKIRHYGISSIRPNVIREYVTRSSLVSVMMQYSLLDRRPEEEMLTFLYENQVGVLARGSLAKGLLISKPPASFLKYSVDQVSKVSNAIQKISSRERPPAVTAARFVLDHPAISSAVIGIRTLEHLNNAIDSINAGKLTEDELKLLSNILPVNYYDNYR